MHENTWASHKKNYEKCAGKLVVKMTGKVNTLGTTYFGVQEFYPTRRKNWIKILVKQSLT